MQSANRVLIVEDDFLVGESLRGMLEDEGYSVIGDTASGKQAIEMTKDLEPDVVMMDIVLLEMDGLTAARHIAGQCPTPIVALTAHENLDLVAEAGESGIGYYLVKPAKRRELTRAIQIATARFDDLMKLRRLNADLQNEITERKQVEEALRESEERYKDAEQVAHLGSWEMDIATGKCIWSDEFFRICGYEPGSSEPDADAGFEIIHPDDRERAAQHVNKTIEAREPYDIEKRIVQPDGTVRWVHSIGEVICDDQGEPMRLVGSFHDITKRHQAEEKLERYATELERSNEELEQFAYVISHDLREPARMVKGYLDLLEKRYQGELGEKADMFIDHAADGAERMQEMIKALLDLSRVGTQGQDPAPTDVEAVFERTLKALRRAIEEAEAEVTHDPLPTVMADEAQLAQVFQNLIANAIKFRREGVPPRVHVSAKREGDEWVFSVADNGIGIDPDQADRIFQIFQRLHTRDEYEGTGIGLALCRRILERHGGRIWVESEVGEGSTFRFTLPARET